MVLSSGWWLVFGVGGVRVMFGMVGPEGSLGLLGMQKGMLCGLFLTSGVVGLGSVLSSGLVGLCSVLFSENPSFGVGTVFR